MKHLFLLALCAAWLVNFSQQTDPNAKNAVGQNHGTVKATASPSLPADKSGKHDIGVVRGKQASLATDTIGLTTTDKKATDSH